MKTHLLSNHKLYNRWSDMKKRCHYKKAQNYYLYGGRGIKVCQEWINDFKAFYDWAIKNGFRNDLFIDRKDVNGNYTPNNCR